jgi:predicted Zn-dependent protease
MIKKFALVFLFLILLSAAQLHFPQGRAVYQKPDASPQEVANSFTSYIEEKYAGEINHNISKSNFVNYTSNTSNYFRVEENKNSLWDGKHWNYSDFPLRVYVKKCVSNHYNNKFQSYIDYAFRIWEESDSRIKFSRIQKLSDADIIISFENNLIEKYDENYLGLTEYDLDGNNKIIQSSVEISLLKYNNKKVSEGEIKTTIVHELGHALGLGHSRNHADLMYPYIDSHSSGELTYVELSTGDMEAIRSALTLGK